MPPAARITDLHVCPQVDPGPVPHVGGPVLSGCPTVLIGFRPAARLNDSATCVPGTDTIVMGCPTVIIGDQPAARMGDGTAHGGQIVTGFPTVLIGESGQGDVLRAAAAAGVPFCEECAKGGLGGPTGNEGA